MNVRIAPTHLLLLLIAVALAVGLNVSAISASARLYNLVVVVPSGLLVAGLAVALLISELRRAPVALEADERAAHHRRTRANLLLLGLFSLFCLALTRVGFDVATFLFVWLGVLLGGERRLWPPLIFAALFTLALVKGFGALLPFPMPLLVL